MPNHPRTRFSRLRRVVGVSSLATAALVVGVAVAPGLGGLAGLGDADAPEQSSQAAAPVPVYLPSADDLAPIDVETHRRISVSRSAERVDALRERQATRRDVARVKEALLDMKAGGAMTGSIKPAPKPQPEPEAAPEQATDPAPVLDAPVGGNRALGRQMMLDFGFGPEQWPALEALWTRESGWNHLAANPSSGAYGIPQSLPGSKMASAGADWSSNPATQIAWGLGYIRDRYGSPQAALAHSDAIGWY